MIMMHASRGRWRPKQRMPSARRLVLLGTLGTIMGFSITMRAHLPPGPVLRIALDQVPVERFVAADQQTPLLALAPLVIPTQAALAAQEPRMHIGAQTQAAPLGPALAATRPAPMPTTSHTPAREALARRAPMLQPDRNGILPIGFSLTGGVSSVKGGVGVSKTLAAEGRGTTGLTIFLKGGSDIEIDREELVAALTELGAADRALALPPAEAGGRLTLNRVRTAGLDLQYDAVRDRLVLRP